MPLERKRLASYFCDCTLKPYISEPLNEFQEAAGARSIFFLFKQTTRQSRSSPTPPCTSDGTLNVVGEFWDFVASLLAVVLPSALSYILLHITNSDHFWSGLFLLFT